MTTPSGTISIVILTFNSEATIARTLNAVRQLSDDIHVVDSLSKDRTREICEAFGCTVVEHPFSNYAAQRNWAIDTLDLKGEWQLHVDADEELEPELIRKIRATQLGSGGEDGYIIGRKLVFMGRVLRFGGIDKTWHCRLFRRGAGRCEDRLYDQHFVCSGKQSVIDGFMLDHQDQTLSEWTIRHDKWSTMEAAEVDGPAQDSTGQVKAAWDGTVIERKRQYKSSYYKAPLFIRSIAYFLYRYFLRLGMLDGVPGLIYHVLQGFWFRFLVDCKIYERRHAEASSPRFPSA